MDNNDAKVSSAELTTLQSDLIQLSAQLHELYELMNSDVSSLGEYWRDQKYDEFITGYKPQMDKMEEISERYHEWATKDLQTTIDNVTDAEGVDVSGSSVGSSPTSSGGDSSSAAAAPSNPFLKGTQKMKDWVQNTPSQGIHPAVQKKWDSEHTHKEGMDANERTYPHQGIINEMAKKEAEKNNGNMFAYLMQKGKSR